MKTLIFILSLFAISMGFEPVRDYAESWQVDSASMTEDTLLKYVLLYSFPEEACTDGETISLYGETLTLLEASRRLASGTIGGLEARGEFERLFWQNISSAFKLLFFYPCVKKDISKRWECVGWIIRTAEKAGFSGEGFSPIEDEITSFVVEVSRDIANGEQY